MNLPGSPKQRFVALRVREVSLVDKPANAEEFLVVKRHELTENTAGDAPTNKQEKDDMATKKSTAQAPQASGAEAGVKGKSEESTGVQAGGGTAAPGNESHPDQGDLTEKSGNAGQVGGGDATEKDDEKDAEKSELAEAQKSLLELADSLKGMVDEVSKGKIPPALKEHMDAKNGKGKDDEEGDEEEVEASEKSGNAGQVGGGDVTMSEKDKKKSGNAGQVGGGDATEKSAEVEKAVTDPKTQLIRGMVYNLQDQTYQLLQLLNIDVSAAAEASAEKSVEKSVKGVSKAQLADLKKKFDEIRDLLKGIAPLQDATAGVKPNAPVTVAGTTSSQSTMTGTGNEQYNAESNVTKSLVEALSSIKDGMTSISKRLDAVESVKGVSKSLDSEVTEKPTQKGSSFWNGVL
jgi:hypothetical protein